MCEDHSAAAVPLESQFRQCRALLHSTEQQCQVGVPLVTDDFAAREAANWDDHLELRRGVEWMVGSSCKERSATEKDECE